MRQYGLEQKVFFTVTDQGSNMVSAFKLELPGFDLSPSEVDQQFWMH